MELRSEIVKLIGTQLQQLNQISGGAKRIADDRTGRRREGDDDLAVALGHENWASQRGMVNELGQPTNRSPVGRTRRATRDLAPRADLTGNDNRGPFGHPRYRRRRAFSSIRESRPAATAPIPTRRTKTMIMISMPAWWRIEYYQRKSMFS